MKVKNNMKEDNKLRTLKEVVSEEDAASEQVKQSEIATLKFKIEEKKEEIERLKILNHKRKIAIIWLSILLMIIIISTCCIGVYLWQNNYNFSVFSTNTNTETLTQTITTEDKIERLATNNDDNAQLLIGQRYYAGSEGYKQDKIQALEWFHKSANNGNVTAIKLLANMYEIGDSIEKNTSSAFKYYFIAARQGDKESLYKVGKFYYYGIGVDKNTDKAIIYLNQSSLQKYQPAISLLDIIKQEDKYTHDQKENKNQSDSSITQ